MRKLFTLLVAVLFPSTFLFAQETHTLTATVTRTKHHTAVTEDLVTEGNFYFKQPGRMCMTFNEGRDRLLMDGNHFIMINDGKSSIAKGKGASHLGLLQNVLQNILLGKEGNINTGEPVEMEITRQDNTISITPVATHAKATRKMMFTSFTLTIDPESSELKSMCMNERGGNYTQYDFSGFVFNDTVDDTVFNAGF